jgi:hypothetical protein
VRRVAYLPVSASLGFSPSIHPSTGLSTPGNPRRNRPSNPIATRPKNAKFSFLGAALEFGGECRWRRAIGGAACERASERGGGSPPRRLVLPEPHNTHTESERERERHCIDFGKIDASRRRHRHRRFLSLALSLVHLARLAYVPARGERACVWTNNEICRLGTRTGPLILPFSATHFRMHAPFSFATAVMEGKAEMGLYQQTRKS